MTDIDLYVTALNIMWVKRLIDKETESAHWKVIPNFYFSKYGENLIVFHFNTVDIKFIQHVKNEMPKFYYNILKAWIKFKQVTCTNVNPILFKEIRQQIIWGNGHITLTQMFSV